MNGLYDTFAPSSPSPWLVFLGASGKATDKVTARGVQIPGGHILSPLHGALSLHIPLLRLGQERRPHIPGVAALCPGAFLRFGNPGLAVRDCTTNRCANFYRSICCGRVAPQAPRPGAFRNAAEFPAKPPGFAGIIYVYRYTANRRGRQGTPPGRFRKKLIAFVSNPGYFS